MSNSPRRGLDFGATFPDLLPPQSHRAVKGSDPIRAPLRFNAKLRNPHGAQRLRFNAKLAPANPPLRGLRFNAELDTSVIDVLRPRPRSGPGFVALVSLTRSGSVATATTSSPHGLRVGALIAIREVDQADYVGDWRVASLPSATTFTFNIAETPASPATGAVTWRRLAQGGVAPGWPGADQVVGIQVLVDGVKVPETRILNWNVRRDRNSGATWSFELAVLGEAPDAFSGSPLGAQASFIGAIPGDATIDIVGIAMTATGPKPFPLVTGGVTHRQQRSSAPWKDAYNGTDRRGRYDRQLVTFTAKPGHGLHEGEVIARVMTALGMPASWLALEKGARMAKELQLRDESPFGILGEIEDARNRLLYFDRRGRLVNPLRVGCNPAAASQIRLTLDERDTLEGSVTRTDFTDVPTTVTLTSVMQLEQDGCQRVTEYTVTEVFTDYAPRCAIRWQDSAGGIHSGDLPTQGEAARRLIQRTVKIVERECDNVVAEREIVMRWWNPEAARYLNDADGISGYRSKVYFYDVAATPADPVTPDTVKAYAWPCERFATVSDTRTVHLYDEDTGVETRALTYHGGWYQRRRALWKRPAVSGYPWDEQDYDAPAGANFWNASGEAVADAQEFWVSSGGYVTFNHNGLVDIPLIDNIQRWKGNLIFGTTAGADVNLETTDFDVERKNIRGRVTEKSGYVRKVGSLYKYADGKDYGARVETFALAETTTESNAPSGEASHDKLRIITDAVTGEYREERDTAQAGYLPTAKVKSDADVDAAIYDTPEQQTQGKVASRHETKTIKVSVTADALLRDHEEWELKKAVTWPENEPELTSLAVRMLREGCDTDVAYSLPCNFAAEENTFQRLTDRVLELFNAKVEIDAVEWNGPADAAWTTNISGSVSNLPNAVVA